MNPPTVKLMDHIQINVTDLPRAMEFYAKIVGLEETPRPPSFDFPGAWYKIGNVDLHLVVRPLDPPSARHFCMWVSDVQAAAKYFPAVGYPVTWDTKYKIRGVDRFFIYDPDQNRIEIQGSDGTRLSRWDA